MALNVSYISVGLHYAGVYVTRDIAFYAFRERNGAARLVEVSYIAGQQAFAVRYDSVEPSVKLVDTPVKPAEPPKKQLKFILRDTARRIKQALNNYQS